MFCKAIRVVRINCLRAREQRERAEDKDFKTHLARISSAGQGLCNLNTPELNSMSLKTLGLHTVLYLRAIVEI